MRLLTIPVRTSRGRYYTYGFSTRALTTLNAKVSATKVCPGCSARYPPDALFCPNDGSPLSTAPFGERDSDGMDGTEGGHDSYLGREISGHIEIRKLAGVGAMGRVYRAFQRGIDRDVAVKVLHRELSANHQLVARFHREAKVASRLQHPNVVQVHLAGQLPDGAMYIVMEYLDGLSLQSAIAAAGGPLPVERALHIALQICDALGEAHAQGVVHRDIKPENVMLIRRGDDPDFVKVLDFGIARLNWGEQSMATAAGLIFGTARYISPEGAQGEAVGPEGDVYATATLLYQMLAGRTPFEGDQAVGLLVQQIHDPPPSIRSIAAASALPEAIAAVIMTNLSKKPAERSPDGRTFGRALVEAAKTIGLMPEELVPRSSLFVPKPRLSDPGGYSALDAGHRASTVKELKAPDFAAIAGPATSLPPGVKTRKWAPATSAPVAKASPRAPGPTGTQFEAPAAPSAFESRVDRTLDDSTSMRILPPPAGAVVRTEPAFPIVAPLVPRSVSATQTPGLGSTLDDDGPSAQLAPMAARPRRSAVLRVVVVCFALGMVASLAAFYQFGTFGGAWRAGSLDEAVAHADEALKHARWDSPPGDNVKDLTNDALTKWPRDARLLEVRERATDELVKEAVGRQFAGDLPAALHLARLANELDPTDTTAQHLVLEYENEAKATGAEPSATTTVRPPPSPPLNPPHGGSHPSEPRAPKAFVEASLPHPRTGQPVTFTAKVSAASATVKTIDDPRFLINGPGLSADTSLRALPEPAQTYVTAFTFFEPGKYDVTFEAKADATLIRATKTIVIDGDTPSPSSVPQPHGVPSSSVTPLPSTVPSGKWL